MSCSRRLERNVPIASYMERSGDCILSQDQGEAKKPVRAERLQAFEMFQSKESATKSSSGNVFGVPLHPRALDAVSAHCFGRGAGRGRR